VGILIVGFIVVLIGGLSVLSLRSALAGSDDVRNRIQTYVTSPMPTLAQSAAETRPVSYGCGCG